MKRKIIKTIFAIFIMLSIVTTFSWGATNPIEKELGNSLNGLTLQEGADKVAAVLKTHGYDESTAGEVTLKEGNNTFNWESGLEIQLIDDVKGVTSMGALPGTLSYKVKIIYNGKDRGNQEFTVAPLGKSLTNQINDYLKTLNIANELTDADINSEEVNGKNLVKKTNTETATLYIKLDSSGKITNGDTQVKTENSGALEVTGKAGVGSKERPEWFKAKLDSDSGSSSEQLDPSTFNPGAPTGYTKVFQVANVVITIVKYLGIIISVIMLVMLGIKFMAGSVEERAEYKKTMIPYFVGAALLFAGSTIVGIIYDVAVKL